MESESWCVYLIECKDGSFYTGTTNDVDKRMDLHASGRGSKYVYTKGFGKLLAVKYCKNRSDACKAESFVKTLPKWEKPDWFKK